MTFIIVGMTIWLTAAFVASVLHHQIRVRGISEPDTAPSSEIPQFRDVAVTRRAYDQDAT